MDLKGGWVDPNQISPSHSGKGLHGGYSYYSEEIDEAEISLRYTNESVDTDELSSVYSYDSDLDESDYSSENMVENHKEVQSPHIVREDNELEELVKNYDEKYLLVNFGEELIKEMILCSMFGIHMSETSMSCWYQLEVERVTKIANGLEELNNMSYSDQGTIMEENLGLLVCLQGAIFFDRRENGLDQLLSSIGPGMIQSYTCSLFMLHYANAHSKQI